MAKSAAREELDAIVSSESFYGTVEANMRVESRQWRWRFDCDDPRCREREDVLERTRLLIPEVITKFQEEIASRCDGKEEELQVLTEKLARAGHSVSGLSWAVDPLVLLFLVLKNARRHRSCWANDGGGAWENTRFSSCPASARDGRLAGEVRGQQVGDFH